MDLSRRRKRVAAGLREALPGLQTRRHVTAYRTAEYVQAPGPRGAYEEAFAESFAACRRSALRRRALRFLTISLPLL